MADLPTDKLIEELDRIKAAAEQDASYYPKVLDGILNVVSREDVTLRIWCSTFFISALTSEAVPDDTKRGFCLTLLDPVVKMLVEARDEHLQRNCIMLAAIIYRAGFEHVARNANERQVWSQLEKLKTTTFELWHESTHFGVKAESIKFAQQVIAVQMFNKRDPRQQQHQQDRDFSLSDVSQNHALIKPSLEAEAQGLMDRVLSVFFAPTYQSQIIIATLFALSGIMKMRPLLVNKIMSTVLQFEVWNKDPETHSPMERDLQVRFVQKALKLFFQHSTATVGRQFANAAHGFVTTMINSSGQPSQRGEKRPASSQLSKNDTRRIKTEQPVPQKQEPSATSSQPHQKAKPKFPPNMSTEVPPPTQPYSYKKLYTLLQPENPVSNLEATNFPLQLAINLTLASIATATPEVYAKCLEVVKQRYEKFSQQAAAATSRNSQYQRGGFDGRGRYQQQFNRNLDDQDGKGPDARDENGQMTAAEIAADAARNPMYDDDSEGEDKSSKTKADEEGDDEDDEDEDQYGEDSGFTMPDPVPLSAGEKVKTIDGIVVRMIASQSATVAGEGGSNSLSIVGSANAGDENESDDNNKGLTRVAFTEWNKNSWVTLLSRLLTRGIGQIVASEKSGDTNDEVKEEVGQQDGKDKAQLVARQIAQAKKEHQIKGVERMAKQMRDSLLKHCLEKFWNRLDIVLEWLNEEWYHEFVRLPVEQRPAERTAASSVYYQYLGKVLDNIIPRVEVSDRNDFIRLLSDLPEFNRDIIWRLKSLCIDPVRIKIGFMSLAYLVRFKPPSKAHSLDLLEELYNDDAGNLDEVGTKLLNVYRPDFLKSQEVKKEPVKEEAS